MPPLLSPVCPPTLLSAHPTRNTGWLRKARQPGARRAPTTSQELLESVAGHLLGVLAPTLRCLLSPLVLHDTTSRPLIHHKHIPGSWTTLRTGSRFLQSFKVFSLLETFVPFLSSCCAHLKGRMSVPTYKAGCDLPSWKSFTVSGDELRNWVNTSLGTVLEACAALHPVLLPRSLSCSPQAPHHEPLVEAVPAAGTCSTTAEPPAS